MFDDQPTKEMSSLSYDPLPDEIMNTKQWTKSQNKKSRTNFGAIEPEFGLLPEVFKEQFNLLRESYEIQLEKGYEEAYAMLQAREAIIAEQRAALIEKEKCIADLKKQFEEDQEAIQNTAEKGYKQAYDIITDLRERLIQQRKESDQEVKQEECWLEAFEFKPKMSD